MINGKLAVHLYAPVLSQSGYGVAARQIMDYCLTDERFIVFLENVPWGNCAFIHENTLFEKEKMRFYYESMARYEQVRDQNPQFDISIYCTIPNEFRRRAQICIGATAGIETDRIAMNWINSCNMMDFIIVPSEFSYDILSKTKYDAKNPQTGESKTFSITKPIAVIPHWFNKPESIPASELTFATDKNFLFVGMWGNKGGIGEDRKDIGTLIKTFYDTFVNENVGLVLKTQIIVDSEEDFFYTQEKIKTISRNYPNAKCKVYLIHQIMSEEEMWSLYNHPQIQALVSIGPEGFGLPSLEMLACGKPVIAANWSGHLDFCKKGKGSILVDAPLKEVPGCQVWENVIDKEARWSRVDSEDLSRKMKKFYSSPKVIQKQAVESQGELIEKFSKDSVVLRWKSFFDTFLVSQEDSKREDVQEVVHKSRKQKEVERLTTKYGIKNSDKEKVLYVMPMSFGDIVISTCIVDSLMKHRHSDDEVYFATKKEYFEVLKGLEKKHGIKTIEYDDTLINSEITREIWDTVYVPGVNVQYTFSNWTLGGGKYALNLFQEFAKQCNLTPPDITDYVLAPEEYTLPSKPFIVLTAVSSKSAKNYKYWNDVVLNIKSMFEQEVDIVQFGMKSEDLIDGVLDYRGITFNQSLFVLQNAVMHIGPDTGMGHAAAALGVPHLALFASTSAAQCAPQVLNVKALQLCIETDCHCSGKAKSYKDVCIKDENGINCLSKISPEEVCEQIYILLKGIKELEINPHLLDSLNEYKLSAYGSMQELFDDALEHVKGKKDGKKEDSLTI